MRGNSLSALSGDGGTPAASRTSRSAALVKIFVRAETASGRSACVKNQRSRQG